MGKQLLEIPYLLSAIKQADTTFGGDIAKYQNISIEEIDNDEYLLGSINDRCDSIIRFIENNDEYYNHYPENFSKSLNISFEGIYAIRYSHYHRQNRHDNIGVTVYVKSDKFEEQYERRETELAKIAERNKK